MVTSNSQPRRSPLFPLGQLVATPGAIAALERSGQRPATFIRHHICGDWGTICASDKRLNDEAVREGTRILSAYKTTADETIWIITEADRSVTTILLPSEY